ncbi:hypothetical protein ABMA27_002524 [Loxostege sticticalis]|uniref:Kazal-like domain-containing protein n=1 Tax=Loxostege sticticalis TaxID=481309 RepID=A0ABR3HTY5_LOXSC
MNKRLQQAIFLFVFLCNQTMGTFHQPVTEANLQGTTSEYIRDCVFNCPKTPEYNPICGTDGVKYYNMGTLRCAQYCGVDVEPTHPAPCSV